MYEEQPLDETGEVEPEAELSVGQRQEALAEQERVYRFGLDEEYDGRLYDSLRDAAKLWSDEKLESNVDNCQNGSASDSIPCMAAYYEDDQRALEKEASEEAEADPFMDPEGDEDPCGPPFYLRC